MFHICEYLDPRNGCVFTVHVYENRNLSKNFKSILQGTQFCMSVMLASAQEMEAGGILEASLAYIGKQEIK